MRIDADGTDPLSVKCGDVTPGDILKTNLVRGTGGGLGGYYIDLSIASRSSVLYSPLQSGLWSDYYVQTPTTYAFERMSSGSAEIIGTGHGNQTHAKAINEMIDSLSRSGNYVTIYANRALTTAGLIGHQRPDIIAVSRNGKCECWEFASPSQSFGTYGYYQLIDKMKVIQDTNPGILFHPLVTWEEISK